MTIKKKARLTGKNILAPDIYSLTFETDLCVQAEPGQFVLLYPNDGSKLLGRPICIADAGMASEAPQPGEPEKGFLRVVFRTIGEGTTEIAGMDTGESLFIEGPLGNGYPMDDTVNDRGDIVLLGGGLGAPSLLFLAKRLTYRGKKNVTAVLGYRDGSLNHFLADDFKALDINTVIATDDGSEGIKGNVLTAINETGIKPGVVYACGPLPMLSAVKKYAAETGAEAYISMEERMACGVGVCLGCVTKTMKKDPHSQVKNARVCTEGPVFKASVVDI
ncbi:MAG: dihydroorotate dehydrogenase electron transfer subunit [Lachnospiraceae bacterium]|nr:dihydroorotate dehydrogenase electron transfer subunit [Lachnospiraceae bacterium]